MPIENALTAGKQQSKMCGPHPGGLKKCTVRGQLQIQDLANLTRPSYKV